MTVTSTVITSAPIVLLLGDDQPQTARLLTQKPGVPLRVEVRGPAGAETRRVEREAVLATLSARATTLQDAELRVQALRAQVATADLDAVWTLVGERPTGATELAELVLAAGTPDARDAILVAVAFGDDGFLLERGQVQRRDAAARAEHTRERAQRLACQAEIVPWLARIDAVRAGQPTRREDPLWIARLTAFARASGTSPPSHDPSITWLLQRRSRRGTATSRDAAELLRELGVWDAHDDLELLRTGLLDPWPVDLVAALPLEPPGPPDEQVDLPLVTIDNDAPHEVDDAIGCARDGTGWRLWVAIANPTAWLPVGSAVDREAARRGTTLYHPRYVSGMLPDELACSRASLLPGQWRPALLFEIGIGATGRLGECQIRAVQVRVARAWAYDRLDAALAAGEPGLEMIRDLADACAQAEAERIRNGAYLMYKPDTEVKAPRHGRIQLNNVAQTSPTRRMITEAMVQCGMAAGRFCAERRLAVPFRGQPPPVHPPLPPGLYTDPADVHSILRTLQPSRTALQPEPHGVLGVPAYVQVTSPLRRYTDVLAQRQILASLRGQPAAHPPQEVATLTAAVEQAQAECRQWQRRGDRYFKLVWLAGRGVGTRLQGQAVRTLARGQVLVWLGEPGLELPVHAAGVEPGDELVVTLRSVHAATGEVELAAV